MAQSADFSSGDVDFSHVEEFDLRYGLTVELIQNLRGIRTLNLVSVQSSNNRDVAGNGPLVSRQRDVIFAGFGEALNPIVDGESTDKKQFILIQVKQNGVADNVSVIVASNKLLCFINGSVCKGVDAGSGEQFDRVGPFNPHV